MLIYALFQNSQGKSALYFIRFISTEKWVGCKHFKSYIFEVFADKRGQVAGDSMTRSRRSSGGSRLLMKALLKSLFATYSVICVVLLLAKWCARAGQTGENLNECKYVRGKTLCFNLTSLRLRYM